MTELIFLLQADQVPVQAIQVFVAFD